jgi:3-deoxy-D-manno-octulosonic-acid transferase
MTLLLYNIFLSLYQTAIRIASLGNPKAKLWINGRKDWKVKLREAIKPDDKSIWFHAASLGEFEQGRPLIERLKKDHTSYKIILTFFSPSGYEIMKDYKGADHIFYLPLDSKKNAKVFIDLLQPSLAIFIKYEFWYHYLHTLKSKNIPVLLVSAAFRKEQPFFKWYGGMFRKMLSFYTAIFVQDKHSKELLEPLKINNVIIAGDTRYDRVANIASSVKSISIVERFKDGKKLLIAGSTWPDDENALKDCLIELNNDWKLIIAPHKIDKIHLDKIQSLFGDDIVFYSRFTDSSFNKKILVIDNIGMLSSLYSYGEIAFIGGGFQKGGIHNILEPAVFGLPVIFGPVYKKFVEANTFFSKGFAFPVNHSYQAIDVLYKLITNDDQRSELQLSIKNFMKESIGASDKIMSYIKDENLLQA